ncbi:50S ribosomal protein L34e [Candidatus Woesearchaeota archaeon]|nr:50S ribosomal protein L34e [Candidatus Woesearchaeota archaeon]MBT5271905.1 50S ribosomal protein L34e [Candidatus Woesearchaeota archaeon]MBT6040688.1 50S ribosomal protein L34e [Candidatus Woesearchaeota archaeon]MBT6336193.1 50S ribosomal protein L34e [Candidatus Woesearchaeota archaeon]MBT7928040.1 50S ribosomal protein L34e [Candidatus Woesearchaeota archaeon]
MVAPKYRSRSLRRLSVRTPGGKTVTHYKRRNPSPAKCRDCGVVLKGIPRVLPSKMKNLPKTAKRPERPYGGVLCSKCMRGKFKASART